ncbi:hypothetical protein [Bifidobacterium eulemuris]|uniref:Radical SAM domain-containing protein n=1 Tax=Bifidobacterium eulemuris TaxID=1765219 RepID=A0A261G9Y5_9BIFI|nr:hypothetical protein [Bifidobacterium eulemuris]OZG68242.1 radical SAM domain-containing protein [Bifidobacterium eulemuris]QOL31702.1 hypothetical protein BE0216_03915 [Bifidobacterium eulemuris]
MTDGHYSVITNFGCHWKCPYCVVKTTGIDVPETDMNETTRTIERLLPNMRFLSFSGGGDPLWRIDDERRAWYRRITEQCKQKGVATEMHTSMIAAPHLLHAGTPDEPMFDRIVYHIRHERLIPRIQRIQGTANRVVFVVAPDFTPDRIDRIDRMCSGVQNVDELSFRQMINPDYSIDRTCEDHLLEGHGKRWHYITQGDYNTYILNDQTADTYESLRRTA